MRSKWFLESFYERLYPEVKKWFIAQLYVGVGIDRDIDIVIWHKPLFFLGTTGLKM